MIMIMTTTTKAISWRQKFLHRHDERLPVSWNGSFICISHLIALNTVLKLLTYPVHHSSCLFSVLQGRKKERIHRRAPVVSSIQPKPKMAATSRWERRRRRVKALFCFVRSFPLGASFTSPPLLPPPPTHPPTQLPSSTHLSPPLLSIDPPPHPHVSKVRHGSEPV